MSVYIDGFNLYHGIHEKFGRKYLWLDLEALAASLLKPHKRWSDELKTVVNGYFTISETKLRQSLLPDPVIDASGRAFPRPASWA